MESRLIENNPMNELTKYEMYLIHLLFIYIYVLYMYKCNSDDIGRCEFMRNEKRKPLKLLTFAEIQH